MFPGCWCSAIGSRTLWWYSWFKSPSFDLHSPVGELHCLHQRALWIRNPLPQSHIVAGYISRSLLYEQVWWVIYSPSSLQIPWGHFPFVVLFIFVKFLSFQDVTPTFWRVTLSFHKESSCFPESLGVQIFIIQRLKARSIPCPHQLPARVITHTCIHFHPHTYIHTWTQYNLTYSFNINTSLLVNGIIFQLYDFKS